MIVDDFLKENEKELKTYLRNNLMSAADAAEMLGCTRQNIHLLVREQKIIPVKLTKGDTLFLKSDLQHYMDTKKRKTGYRFSRKEVITM